MLSSHGNQNVSVGHAYFVSYDFNEVLCHDFILMC